MIYRDAPLRRSSMPRRRFERQARALAGACLFMYSCAGLFTSRYSISALVGSILFIFRFLSVTPVFYKVDSDFYTSTSRLPKYASTCQTCVKLLKVACLTCSCIFTSRFAANVTLSNENGPYIRYFLSMYACVLEIGRKYMFSQISGYRGGFMFDSLTLEAERDVDGIVPVTLYRFS